MPGPNAISNFADKIAARFKEKIPPQETPVYTRPVTPERPAHPMEEGFDINREASRKLMAALAPAPKAPAHPPHAVLDNLVAAAPQASALNSLHSMIDSVHSKGQQFSLREVAKGKSNLLHLAATSDHPEACAMLTEQMGNRRSGYSPYEVLKALRSRNAAGHTPSAAANEAGFPARALALVELQVQLIERLSLLQAAAAHAPDAAV